MTETKAPLFKTHMRWLLPLFIILMAIALVLVLKMTRPTAPSKPIKEKVWTVQAMETRFGSFAPQLQLFGSIQAPASSTMTSAVTAFVEQRQVSEGEQVEAGQLLIQLDNRDAALTLTQREAAVESIKAQIAAEMVQYQTDLKSLKIEKELVNITQRRLDRYKDLSSRQVASQSQLDDAQLSNQQQALSLASRQKSINDHPNRLAQLEAQLKQAVALMDVAALDLERTSIKAPFTGRIADVAVAAGDRVRGGDKLLSLYSTDNLEVRSQIPSRYLPMIRGHLAAGNEIFATAMLDGQQMQLRLERLAATVENGKVGVDALLSIVSAEYKGEPGRAVSLQLNLPSQNNLLALPPQAIFGTDRVYVIEDDRLQLRTVERIGESRDEQGNARILVRSDVLVEGDKILMTQLPNAVSGLKVKIAGSNNRPAVAGKPGNAKAE